MKNKQDSRIDYKNELSIKKTDRILMIRSGISYKLDKVLEFKINLSGELLNIWILITHEISSFEHHG